LRSPFALSARTFASLNFSAISEQRCAWLLQP
jgi:hypothetical protein